MKKAEPTTDPNKPTLPKDFFKQSDDQAVEKAVYLAIQNIEKKWNMPINK
ncbi:MAG: hypothetical protein ACXVPE_17575 [Bacteroidia bacterium]